MREKAKRCKVLVHTVYHLRHTKLVLAVIVFTLVIYHKESHLAVGLVLERLTDAFGDVFLDRGLES